MIFWSCSHRVQLPRTLKGLSNEIAGVRRTAPNSPPRRCRFNGWLPGRCRRCRRRVVPAPRRHLPESRRRRVRCRATGVKARGRQFRSRGSRSAWRPPDRRSAWKPPMMAACRGCGSLVSPACAHVHAGASVSCDRHARRCRSSRAVVVESGQRRFRAGSSRQKLPLDGEQGEAREVALSGVAHMSPVKRHVARKERRPPSEMIPRLSHSICSPSNSKRSSASRCVVIPAEASRRRRRRPKEPKVQRRAVPSFRAASSIVKLTYVSEERCGCRCRHSVSLRERVTGGTNALPWTPVGLTYDHNPAAGTARTRRLPPCALASCGTTRWP